MGGEYLFSLVFYLFIFKIYLLRERKRACEWREEQREMEGGNLGQMLH